MSMFLPLGSGQIAGNFGVRFSNSANYSSIELSMGRVGRHTVVGGLKKQVQAGDPVIVLEVLKDTGDINPQCICTLPTRASLLLAAMESDAKSILLSKSDKDLAQAATFRRRDTTVAYSLARLSLCTLLAIGAVWMLYLDSGQILELTPRFPFFGGNGAPTIDEVLPIYPRNQLEAYDLGAFATRLQHSTGDHAPLLKEASAMLGRLVTAAELKGVRATLLTMESHQSIVQKVWGFFSFVNIMWLAAIFGVAVSIGPALWVVMSPLRDFFGKLSAQVIRLLVWVAKEIVFPIGIRLHTYGIFEIAAFAMAFMLTAQGQRMGKDAGMYVCISGLVALHLCAMYSFQLHGRRLEAYFRRANWGVHEMVPGVVVFAFCTPMALQYSSTLIAYAATAAICTSLGFGFCILPFCYVIGWQDRSGMVRSAATAATVLSVYSIACIMQVDPAIVAPFQSPVSVLGSVNLFLCLLIMSSYYYERTRGGGDYLRRNGTFLAAAMAAMYVGQVFGLTGMANTATTFFVLWVLEKYSELHFENNWNMWVFVLLSSGVMYKSALWLHANPAFVVSLFSPLETADPGSS